jgi:hypothetical protein
MWLFSGVPDHPQDDMLMAKHGANELHSAVKNLMHAIWPEHKEAQQDAAHWMIRIVKPWMVWR